MRIVEIFWEDSVAGRGWMPQDDAVKWAETTGHLQSTASYLFAEDERSVTLVQSQQVEGPNVGDAIQIPKSAIHSAIDVRTGRRIRWRS